MIKNILLLLWNQRSKYLGIFVEQIFVFVILIICTISLTDALRKYNSPGQIKAKNAILLGYMMYDNINRENLIKTTQLMDNITEVLKNKPYVKAITKSMQFLPYLRPSEYYSRDSVTVSANQKIFAHIKGSDASAKDVFELDITAGKWFEAGERPDGFLPAVITTQFALNAGMDNPIGKMLSTRGQMYRIVGVLSGLKESVFEESPPVVIIPVTSWPASGFYSEYAARIEAGYEEYFYSDFFGEFTRMYDNSISVEPILSSMDRWRADTMRQTVLEVSVIAVPTIFLFTFALLGTMGLSLLDMRSRRSEFALRVSCGAVKLDLIRQVVLQNLIISVLAAIPAVVIVLFAYEWNSTLLFALFITFVLILLFSLLSSWYPAYVTTNINPAQALKYE